MAYEDRFEELELYLASERPWVEVRLGNCPMAIGLQAVDRLNPSKFLLELAGDYNIISMTLI